MTINDVALDGRLLYQYVAGSTLYHCNNEDSDIDTKGLFIAKQDEIYGLGFDKQFRDRYKGILDLFEDEIKDERNDNVIFEIGKYMGMLLSSNANVLESLFVPNEMIIVKPHKCLEGLFANRDKFITKACFWPFVEYAIKQIGKARGLNKKIVNPVTERLTPFDFAYTFYNQGSTKIKNWLENRGLEQEFCGLVHIPNMHDTYGVYYDWGAHFEKYGIKEFKDLVNFNKGNTFCFILDFYGLSFNKQGKAEEWFEKNKEVKHYRGMCLESSNDMRGSSVSKGEKPLCWMVYNESGYKDHCKKYKEYKDWEKFRNPKRYESNLNKNYDCYLESETEFLTNHGWKKYDDITVDDLIGCFSDCHTIEYHKYLNRFDGQYSGEIYTYESPYVKFSVTPNHKLYISRCHRNISNLFSTKYNSDNAKWELIKVFDYFNSKNTYYHQLQHLSNANVENKEYSDDFIKLLGMFLSEGCFLKRKESGEKFGVRIAQTNGRCGCDIMDSITTIGLKKYVYNYPERNKGDEYTYDCTDQSILEKLIECGDGATNKDIPSYVFTFSKRQFDILLNSLICGDGSKHKAKGHTVYYTYSYKMAKTLHTLLELNGYNAQIYGGEHGSYQRVYESSYQRKDRVVNPSYQVFISKFDEQYHVINKNRHWSKKNVENARIVCFQTPYGTLVTRNGNKMAFHGNSKNMYHCIRLIRMGKEIANGDGIILDRREAGDRDFIMDVRNHKYEYDELMEIVNKDEKELNEAIAKSTLPENIDFNLVNDLLIDIRKKFYASV